MTQREIYSRRKFMVFLSFVLPGLIAIFCVSIYPLAYAVNLSLHYFSTRMLRVEGFAGVQNYLLVLSEVRTYQNFLKSFIYTGLSVLGSIVLGMALALLLNKPFPGRKILRSLFIIPMVMTPVTIGLIWKIMYNPSYGIYNYILKQLGLGSFHWLGKSSALFSVILVDIWQWTPFMMVICLAGLDSLPSEPIEAAIVDGANRFQVFRLIALPLLLPVLKAAALIRAVDAINTFDTIYIMTQGGPGIATETMIMRIYLVGFRWYHLELGATMSILLVAILIIMGYFYYKLGIKKG